MKLKIKEREKGWGLVGMWEGGGFVREVGFGGLRGRKREGLCGLKVVNEIKDRGKREGMSL